MKRLQYFLESQAFGVCTAIGKAIGVPVNVIRLYFIYVSFLTMGSPIVLYLFMAFWMNFKRYTRQRFTVRELH